MGTIRNITVKTISATFGEAHFIVQSTADAIAHSEGYLLSKLTDSTKSEIITKRRAITKTQQSEYKSTAKDVAKLMRNKFTAPAIVSPTKTKK